MDTTLEVLTKRWSRREAHRQWPDDIKARIVSESLLPGVTVNEVAERHGLKANHLASWRTQARQGKLVLPEPEDAVEFAAMVVEMPTPEPATLKVVSRAEIVVGPVTIRLEEGVQPLDDRPWGGGVPLGVTFIVAPGRELFVPSGCCKASTPSCLSTSLPDTID